MQHGRRSVVSWFALVAVVVLRLSLGLLMASHENREGFLDYGSGRYKPIGRAGREDHYLHAGEWVQVWIGTQWVAVQVQADEWGRWYFLDADGARVEVQVGMRARLGS